MKSITGLTVAALAAISLAVPAAAGAAGPPLPVSASGKNVNVFATGVSIPTQLAFAGKDVFIAGGAEGKAKGGIFVRKPGSKAVRRVPGTPSSVFGVAWQGRKLYASEGKSLVVYGKWNGKRFLRKRTLYTGPKGNFTGFNGIAFGPNGRLYAGVTLQFDSKASKKKFANSVISIRKDGTGIKLISKGLRQPWMLAFAKGEKSPIVTVLGAETPKSATPADLLVKATPGSNFGFPECDWDNTARCGLFTDPLMILRQDVVSASPMGIAAKGRKLFVALFTGIGKSGPEVVSTDTEGSLPVPVLTGFPAPVLSVASHKGFLYAGDFTGRIYRVHD